MAERKRLRVFEDNESFVLSGPSEGSTSLRAVDLVERLSGTLRVALAQGEDVEVSFPSSLASEVELAVRHAALNGGLLARSADSLVMICTDKAEAGAKVSTAVRGCLNFAS